MVEVTISKNEYIALELTKAWCGQGGSPAKPYEVSEVYEEILKELEEDNK